MLRSMLMQNTIKIEIPDRDLGYEGLDDDDDEEG